MSTKVLVPRLGEGVEEVNVTKWLTQVGESVQELEALLEVNTDKVDTEIPAPVSGVVLQIAVAAGLSARVGDLLAILGEPGEQLEETKVSAPRLPSARPAENKPVEARPKELGFISPVVAKIASEHGVNLAQVRGSGLGGRITKNDVLLFVENSKSNYPEISQPLARPAVAAEPVASGDSLIKHSLMRKSIAEHMLASKRTSPHVLTVMEVDMSRVVAHRSANKTAFAQNAANLTYTAYFMLAAVAGLKAYPLVNSSWSDEGVILHAGIHLGMATSLGQDGLIVPVIKAAEGLSLLGMARAINDLAARARAKKLRPDEVKGGTFTLTNHGISGSLLAMPIINQPQCGILGIGALQKRVVVVSDALGNDSIAIRPMVYLSFVFDHRILDGASADWFVAKVKEKLENWSE